MLLGIKITGTLHDDVLNTPYNVRSDMKSSRSGVPNHVCRDPQGAAGASPGGSRSPSSKIPKLLEMRSICIFYLIFLSETPLSPLFNFQLKFST